MDSESTLLIKPTLFQKYFLGFLLLLAIVPSIWFGFRYLVAGEVEDSLLLLAFAGMISAMLPHQYRLAKGKPIIIINTEGIEPINKPRIAWSEISRIEKRWGFSPAFKLLPTQYLVLTLKSGESVSIVISSLSVRAKKIYHHVLLYSGN